MELIREWAPLVSLVNNIPTTIQRGLLFHDVSITCIDLVDEFIALGSNVGLVFWYNRKSGTVERLATDNAQHLTVVRIISTVEFMVAVGCKEGTVNIFQIPKVAPPDVCAELLLKSKPTELYTIRGLHRVRICDLTWSKNGMKLFSGDASGIVVLTEINYQSKSSESREIVNERYEIVQMDLRQGQLLVSTTFRTVICNPNGSNGWRIAQVGKKDRKMVCPFGAVFHQYHGEQQIICTRSGFRLWVADFSGNVAQTLIFKDLIKAPCPEIPVLNPTKHPIRIPTTFGTLRSYRERQMLTVANDSLFLLDLDRMSVIGSLTRLRRIQDIAVHRHEILILENSRSLVRISTLPDNSQNTILYKNLELFASTESQIVQADECREEDADNAEEPPSDSANIIVQPSVDAAESSHIISSHMKKLELFDTLNELKYDDSILFKTGRNRRRHHRALNGIVEIGQIPKEMEAVESEAEPGNSQPKESGIV